MRVAPEPGAVTARLVIATRIGPAQGVQTRPRPTPVISPPATPGRASRTPTPGRRAVSRSNPVVRAGTSKVRPNTAMTAMAMARSVELGRRRAWMIWTLARVKNEKLAMRPAITRYGRRRSPSAPVASTIGRIGSTHGDTAVTSPATNATTISRSIVDVVPPNLLDVNADAISARGPILAGAYDRRMTGPRPREPATSSCRAVLIEVQGVCQRGVEAVVVLATGVPSLDEAFRLHQPWLVQRLALVVGDAEEARDLAQQTFVRAAEKWPLPPEQDVPRWLAVVGLRLALNERRRRRLWGFLSV